FFLTDTTESFLFNISISELTTIRSTNSTLFTLLVNKLFRFISGCFYNLYLLGSKFRSRLGDMSDSSVKVVRYFFCATQKPGFLSGCLPSRLRCVSGLLGRTEFSDDRAERLFKILSDSFN